MELNHGKSDLEKLQRRMPKWKSKSQTDKEKKDT